MTLDGEVHCVRPDQGTFQPQPGDRVLVFGYMPGTGAAHTILEADPTYELIFERGGTLVLPQGLRRSEPLASVTSLQEVLALTAAHLQRIGRGASRVE